ncbi:MAG: hypothetical protein J7K54_05310 [Candidatus Aenigmarchaeota archaeon]|nr:hypothetical protein [Candidatus Aenigmarchaeota archaeon]
MTAKEEMKDVRISIAVHSIVAILIGVLSPYLGRALFAVSIAVVAGLGTGKLTEFVVGKHDFKWWASNGLFLYLFVWFDMWVITANYFSMI